MRQETIENYLKTCICSLIGISYMSFQSNHMILNTAFSIGSVIFMLTFTVFTGILLKRNSNKLNDEIFKEKYESLYDELRYDKKAAILSTTIFMLRRMTFAIALIFL